jgi:hypothetical protein
MKREMSLTQTKIKIAQGLAPLPGRGKTAQDGEKDGKD